MTLNASLLKNIIDNTPHPIAVYSGEELKIELANTAMIETWGEGGQIIGGKYSDLVSEIEKKELFKQALTVLKTGIPYHVKNKKVNLFINGIQEIHYFDYSFLPLKDIDGLLYGVMNTCLDTTELHLAREKLQSSDERLRIAVDSAGMGTYELDLETKEIKSCGNFNTIWSIDGNVPNELLIARLHPEDLPVREKAHQKAQVTGKISYEARIINPDQSIKHIQIDGKIIKDKTGNPITIIGIIQDISGQRNFEEELKSQVAGRTLELSRSNDDLLHFANVVSHDLREPVRKIKTFNNLLKNEKESTFSDNAKNYIQKIDQSAQRMHTIIEGILDYSTIDKSRQPVESISLNEVVENITADLELAIKEKDAIVNTCVLPEVQGAPILIYQLFFNLIQNALKFSKSHQPPRVIIGCSAVKINDKDSVKITIKDNGIGFDSAYAERIFTAFERLHSKDQYEGNGLGLSLCRKIVERHNGTITAAGGKDNGAEFTVTLPLEQLDNKI